MTTSARPSIYSPYKYQKMVESNYQFLSFPSDIIFTIVTFLKNQEHVRLQSTCRLLNNFYKSSKGGRHFTKILTLINERLFPPMEEALLNKIPDLKTYNIHRSSPIKIRMKSRLRLNEIPILSDYSDIKSTEDGKLVICCVDESHNGSIKIFDPESRKKVDEVSLGRIQVEPPQVNPTPQITQKDNNHELVKYVQLQITSDRIVIDFFNNPLIILSFEKGSVTSLSRPETNSLWGPAYVTPDGKKVLKFAHDGSRIKIWDLKSLNWNRTQNIVLKRSVLFGEYRPLVQKAQDTLFFVCKRDIWMLDCKEWHCSNLSMKYDIVCFQLSPEGALAVIADRSIDQTTSLKLYSLKESHLLNQIFLEQFITIHFLIFNSPKEVIVSGHSPYTGGMTLFWDIERNKLQHVKGVKATSIHREERFGRPHSYHSCTLFRSRVFYSYGAEVIIRDLRTQREIANNKEWLSISATEVFHIIIQKNGSVITLNRDGFAYLYDLVYHFSRHFEMLVEDRHDPLNAMYYQNRLKARCLE
ncbi:MAG: hypothetical protein WAM28_03130 [Chlamydiales bacterium]